MSKKTIARLVAAGFMLTGVLFGEMAKAQDAPIAEQLRAHYKLAKMGWDASGSSVVDTGTVLVIQKGGIVGVPPANLGTPPIATYKDGDLHGPGAWAMAMLSKVSRQLTVGEKIYVIKIDVHAKDDKIVLTIVECDSCNSVQQPASFKSAVAFQFAKGYLSKADASQVEDVISEVLAPEASQDEQAQTEQPAVAPAGAQDILQNQDIIDLVKAGFDDATILAKMEHSKCQFDTSKPALILLKQSRVSGAVIKAMISKTSS
ncbi:MAG: hypothetical protein ABSH39_03780 [Candidatus Acidiferrum sp.]